MRDKNVPPIGCWVVPKVAGLINQAPTNFSMVRVVKPEPAEDSADIFLCPPQACLLEKGGWKPVPPDR